MIRSYPNFTIQNSMPCQYNFLHKIPISERPYCRSQEQLWRNLTLLYLLPPWPIPNILPFFCFHFWFLPSHFHLIPVFHGCCPSSPHILLLIQLISHFSTAFKQLLKLFWTTYCLPKPLIPVTLIFFFFLISLLLFIIILFVLVLVLIHVLHYDILLGLLLVLFFIVSLNPLCDHIVVPTSIFHLVWGITSQLLLLQLSLPLFCIWMQQWNRVVTQKKLQTFGFLLIAQLFVSIHYIIYKCLWIYPHNLTQPTKISHPFNISFVILQLKEKILFCFGIKKWHHCLEKLILWLKSALINRFFHIYDIGSHPSCTLSYVLS
uniref:Uncharacterized protein n=1 Tax=Cucumis sativus TaxID=3659 RepID=A0A0A0L4L0_CUCSA